MLRCWPTGSAACCKRRTCGAVRGCTWPSTWPGTLTSMADVLVTRVLPAGGVDGLRPYTVIGPDPDDRPLGQDALIEHAAAVDAIVCLLTDRIDAAVLAAGAGRLKVVANVAVGYDNIDVAAAAEHGIVICNTPGVLDETTADTAFLLIL